MRIDRLSMQIFCDANFAGDNSGMKSTTVFALIVSDVGTVYIYIYIYIYIYKYINIYLK